MKLSAKAIAVFLCGCAPFVQAEQEAPRNLRLAVRYVTPKGIGFNRGYTTLEGFFIDRDFCRQAWRPLLDVRGHIFDNGKWAANLGTGVRYLGGHRLWGINLYYDYRSARHQQCHQIGPGLESLGRVWDFRLNSYFPIGKKSSSPYNTEATFQGNSLLIRYAQKFVLNGVQGEVGAHVDCKEAPLYFAAGPYFLGSKHKRTWGGEARGRIELFYRYLRLEAMASYDSLFKWIGQAQISVNIPLGKRIKISPQCSSVRALNDRAVQSIDRFEIIPQGKRHHTTPALNPATGEPWTF